MGCPGYVFIIIFLLLHKLPAKRKKALQKNGGFDTDPGKPWAFLFQAPGSSANAPEEVAVYRCAGHIPSYANESGWNILNGYLHMCDGKGMDVHSYCAYSGTSVPLRFHSLVARYWKGSPLIAPLLSNLNIASTIPPVHMLMHQQAGKAWKKMRTLKLIIT